MNKVFSLKSLVIVFTISLIGIGFSSCEKDNKLVKTNNVIDGISLVEDSNYGNYLSFPSEQSVKNKIFDWKDNVEEIDKWVSQFGEFNSFREKNPKFYDIELSSILNENGYIMVGGNLFRQDLSGDVFLLKNGKEELIHKFRKKSSCASGSKEDEIWQRVGHEGALILNTHVEIIDGWLSDKIIASVKASWLEDGNFRPVDLDADIIGINYSYGLVDEDNWIEMGETRIEKEYASEVNVTIYEGDDICVSYLYVTLYFKDGYGDMEKKYRFE